MDVKQNGPNELNYANIFATYWLPALAYLSLHGSLHKHIHHILAPYTSISTTYWLPALVYRSLRGSPCDCTHCSNAVTQRNKCRVYLRRWRFCSTCDHVITSLSLSLSYTVQHLTYVYNLCINHNCFPSDLKTAKAVPLSKGKDLTDINNYRSISVLSSISKPLEKHVHKHLLKYFDRFNLIHTHQSGFRPQNSCQSALTCLVARLLSSINKSKLNGVVFLDLKKAFDLIDHQILLKKMKMYQLSGNAIQFLKIIY